MDYYDKYLDDALSVELSDGSVKNCGNSLPFFDRIAKAYPADGSKIKWTQTVNAAGRRAKSLRSQVPEFVDFFDRMVEANDLSGTIVYVGDSATDNMYVGSISSFRSKLIDIFYIPQHHYFCAVNLEWCMAFTMEGCMDFGHAPRDIDLPPLR